MSNEVEIDEMFQPRGWDANTQLKDNEVCAAIAQAAKATPGVSECQLIRPRHDK